MKKQLQKSNLSFFLFFALLFFTSLTSLKAQSCDLISANFNLGGPSHDSGFQTHDGLNAIATLSNGNFVVAWETRDDVDGHRHGGFFQIFAEDGTAVTGVTIPYTDVNPMGTGDQGTPGPRVIALESGFVIVWTSEDGPGDTGPTTGNQQDVFFRVYDNIGNPSTGSTRLSVADSDDKLSFVLPLSTGGFVLLTHVNEDNVDDKDDYYFAAYNAAGISTSGGLVNITSGAHDAAFQEINRGQSIVELDNGKIAVTWETRDDVDGDGTGAFFRIFNTDGTAVSDIIIPYGDINAAGTGDQGRFGPKIIGLANDNLVVSWESRKAPGDVGPTGSGPGDNNNQDSYFRIYNSTGLAVTATTKANSDNTADTESVNGIIELTGGNFAFFYHRAENNPGNNKDDYFVRTFTSAGIPAGASIEVSDGAHTESFCAVLDKNRSFKALNNGNFVVGWAARDDSDGDDAGAYYRVFSPNGTAVSPVTFPYVDINPMGTGKQSTFGLHLDVLPDGFAVAWQSKDGPGDVGPSASDLQDVYHRVIDNSGTPLCGSTKTNTDNDGEEEVLAVIHPLANGNFVVLYHDQEEPGANKDDYFIRVIGGAPLQTVCPALGTATVSDPAACIDEAFNITVTGLQNMAMSSNNEQNYGVRFITFANPTSTPYTGGVLLGTVPFGNLTNNGTMASLTGVSISNADQDVYIYAILDPAPGDVSCLPSAQTEIEISSYPTVTFTAPSDLCIDEGLQNGLGGAIPNGGVYSGPGVTDNGNGMNYSFNPTTAGIGTHTISYNFTNAAGCSASASDLIEVFSTPTVVFTAPSDLCIDAGLQTGLGGATPAGGVYSGLGVTDNGNGTTYSFDPSTAGVGVHAITYNFDDNGCSGSASDAIEVFAEPTIVFTAPDNLCVDAEVQNGLGDATPNGGIYSGPGVMDDGNGTTFTFDPATAGVGIHSIAYNFDDNGCSGSASVNIEVFALPAVSISLPDTIFVTDGMPPQNVNGGGLPVGGIYSDAFNEASDDGNGETFSFLNNFLVGDTNIITYTVTDVNGCSNSASKTVFVADGTVGVETIEALQVEVFPNPTSGIINLKGAEIDRIEVLDIHGRVLQVEKNNTSFIDISSLPAGFYFIKIEIDGRVASTRIVKE